MQPAAEAYNPYDAVLDLRALSEARAEASRVSAAQLDAREASLRACLEARRRELEVRIVVAPPYG